MPRVSDLHLALRKAGFRSNGGGMSQAITDVLVTEGVISAEQLPRPRNWSRYEVSRC